MTAAPGSAAQPYRLQVRPDSFTLSRGAELVLSFDLDGRPLTWFSGGTLHKRSLASQVLARRRVEGSRERWSLTSEQAREQFAQVNAWLREAREHDPSLRRSPLLTRAAEWTPGRLMGEQERFSLTYSPISILPPDQYYSVVVQVTRGCSWNQCTFCTFYRDRPFTTLPPTEFQSHLVQVGALLGGSLALRRSIFLADGNALMVSNARLLPALDAVCAAFPGRPVNGFVDVFTGQRKCVTDWQALRDAGLKRVYVGLETGHDPLLAWVNKPGGREASRQFVSQLKEAGLEVGVIVMTGLGGLTYAAGHVADTSALLEQLPLSSGDLVYLSPFVEHGPYVTRATEDDVAPLPEVDRLTQEMHFRSLLSTVHPGVQVARYDIREFIY
ncbi:radical SAM protein [Deinococcus enclensis]|uniref:Radical SAM superfamily enzyme YgiQ (UPF0313 family) n=1 Tax=Deinococcus enclensis TaxID=1049582 RepID=A0ABT9MCG6_9DEIO|nr:radical SAM protein [Deinococcus enclensis]MDP9763949.1 radical SAM superfamily enzyme YgiQ (UPF0313 family) [Deinococcus enclensis]